jgi:hypothetical protein
VGDIEPGTVEAYLRHRKVNVSAETARVGWVALRSVAEYLAQLRIHGDGESVLRHVRMPRVKENHRRNLSDAEMWKVIECSPEGAQAGRDHAIVITLLGTGVRREEPHFAPSARPRRPAAPPASPRDHQQVRTRPRDRATRRGGERARRLHLRRPPRPAR